MSIQVKMKPTIKYPYMGDKVAKRLFDIESKPKRMLVSYIIAHELNMDVLDVYNNILVLSINPSISNQTVGAKLDLNYYIRESSYIVNLEANTYDNEKAKVKNQNYIYLLATKDIKSSDDYNNPKKILQLNFDTFDIYHDGEVSYTIEPREIKKNRPGGFNFKSIHYNLTYFDDLCYNDVIGDNFLLLLYAIAKGNTEEIPDEAFEGELEFMKDVREDIDWYMQSPDYKLWYNGEKLKEECIKDEAKTEGLVEGKAQGLVEGKAEGLVEGKANKQVEIAKNMLNKGSDIDFISEVTGLSIEEIEELKETK